MASRCPAGPARLRQTLPPWISGQARTVRECCPVLRSRAGTLSLCRSALQRLGPSRHPPAAGAGAPPPPAGAGAGAAPPPAAAADHRHPLQTIRARFLQ
eukprot:767597-Hanusia_phi.AAC.13